VTARTPRPVRYDPRFAPRDILLLRMADLLRTRFTGAGHLAAIVDHEHRGNCPPRECGPGCLEATALLDEAVEHLEAAIAAQPVQLRMEQTA
jgi:hypothetical protein